MGDTVTKRDDALRKAPFPVLEMMLEFRDAERADPAWMEAARRHFDEGDKSIDIWRLLAKRYGKSRSNHPSYPCAPLSPRRGQHPDGPGSQGKLVHDGGADR